jgi:hypothetical protein
MTRPMGLLQWSQTVSTSLPHLSQLHRTGLALWSCGIVLAQNCGLTTVTTFLAYLLRKGEATVRKQLRDWYRDGAHKSGATRGDKRRTLEVSICFAPLLRVWPQLLRHAVPEQTSGSGICSRCPCRITASRSPPVFGAFGATASLPCWKPAALFAQAGKLG